MKPDEIKTILDDHAKWLRGKGGKQANLRGANLSWANLSRADLSGANLSWANLSAAQVAFVICRMDFGGWSICVYADKTSIGCQTHPNDSWLAWMPDSEKIKRMHPEAASWWATHGEAIKAVIRCVQAKSKGGEA